MKDQLTPEQIHEIAAYSYGEGIKYYDLELEMVDHMSEWILNEQSTNHLSFETAFEQMKKEFPKADLHQIMKSKKRSLETRIARLTEKEMISFFTVPRIFLTICLLTLAMSIPYLLDLSAFAAIIGLSILAIYTSYYYSGPPKKEVRAMEEMERLHLLSTKVRGRYEMIIKVVVVVVFILNTARLFLPDDFLHYRPGGQMSQIKKVVMQCVTVGFVLFGLLNASVLTVRKKMLTRIMDDYPKAFTE